MQRNKSAAHDAGRFIAVDRPRVVLWVQMTSAKLLGFTPFALLNQRFTRPFAP